MKTPKNDDHLQQELRVAQLEIKMLREQLLKVSEAAQLARERDSSPTDIASNRTTSAPRRVLYVEDSEPNFRLIESILSDRSDTELFWGETGEKGFELAVREKPQVILLDLNLPDMHGSELLQRLQARAETAQTPVIVISADATPSQIERMLAAGARNYLTKPFEIRRFLYMLDEVFAPA